MQTLSPPPRQLSKEYVNTYPRLLPASRTHQINDKFFWLYSIKHKNTAKKSIYPFFLTRRKDHNLLKRPLNITFERVTEKDLKTTYQHLGLWFLCGGPTFLLLDKYATALYDLSGVIFLLIVLVSASLFSAAVILKN